MKSPSQFLAIDEEGFIRIGEARLNDPEQGLEVLENLTMNETGALVSKFGNEACYVEAFDEPLVVQHIEKNNSSWTLLAPYHFRAELPLENLRVDEWDRFHGRTIRGIPFVFSRSAQMEFFNLVDEFNDESVTVGGRQYQVLPLYDLPQQKINQSDFWNSVYVDEGRPGWDLAQPAPALTAMLPKLKLNKCRVLVLGCGEGHDAAAFAKEGHVVTAVDFSAEAIQRAKQHYHHLDKIEWVQCDLFQLPPEWAGSFDLIFEHTCFCAIQPTRRSELVQVWNRLLTPQGFLMGVFFTMDKLSGPPFGASEWELRQRLKKYFRFLYWGRWQYSHPRRIGKELFIYAQSLKG